jgi:hypothetical protein
MSQLCTCHVSTITVLFYPGRQRPRMAEAVQGHSAELVVPTGTGMGGRR